MLKIELKNTKISLDEEKRKSNFILGFLQEPNFLKEPNNDEDLVTIGFMPTGYPEILAALIHEKSASLLDQAWDLLDDRDAVENWEDWDRFTRQLDLLLEQIYTLEVLGAAFHWNDGSYTHFDFEGFGGDYSIDPDIESIEKEMRKGSHLR